MVSFSKLFWYSISGCNAGHRRAFTQMTIFSGADINPTRPQGGSAESDKETASENEIESSVDNESTSDESGGGGGFVDAVVGGIADGLGLDSGAIGDGGVGGLNVDLGPVLDAVATLLRGPIRSAIENRRSEAAQVYISHPLVEFYCK